MSSALKRKLKLISVLESSFQNKLVRERELEGYLNSGWEIVQTVNGKILIRKKV
jgi:hypothetical protein